MRLQSLPPTTEAFTQNVYCSHFQTAIWKSANQCDPPEMDPCNYGWVRSETMQTLDPETLRENVPLAPAEVLEMIRCACSTDNLCLSARCAKAQLSCSVFCHCKGEQY